MGEAPAELYFLRAEEVAEYFGVRTTVCCWCREGRIPCPKIGKRWCARRGDLEDFLKEAEESGGARCPDRRASKNVPSAHPSGGYGPKCAERVHL
jgi:excisionase family DNA binding protein